MNTKKNIHILEYVISIWGDFWLLPDRFRSLRWRCNIKWIEEGTAEQQEEKRSSITSVIPFRSIECAAQWMWCTECCWMDGWLAWRAACMKTIFDYGQWFVTLVDVIHIHSIFHCSVFNLFVYDSGLFFLSSLELHLFFTVYTLLCHRWLMEVCEICILHWPKPTTQPISIYMPISTV